MNNESGKRRDFIQNIVIVLLSISALFLFAQTQLYSLIASSKYVQFLSGDNTQADIAALTQEVSYTAPVRIAVSGAYGRYGNLTLTTADEDFSSISPLLKQALESAQQFSTCERPVFLSSLLNTSVFCDFLAPLPLPVLAQLVDADSREALHARYLVVAERSSGVFLYLWDGAEACYRSDTTLSAADLQNLVNQFELGNATLALDAAEPNAAAVAPCSLFLREEPALPVLNAEIPLSDIDRLLTVLQFNPNTQNRYPTIGGTEVIVDGGRTLRIRTDGTVTYQSGNTPVLSIPAAGEIPTQQECTAGTAALLNSLLLPALNDASIYLKELRQSGSQTTLLFGYQVDGVPIRFSDGLYAAEVTLTGSTVTAMTFLLREYSLTETASRLLPLRQTLAIAAQQQGAELSIGYIDSGADTVQAGWLADEPT